MPHPSLQFVKADHLLFEQQLIRYPLDIKTWLRYIEYQQEMVPKLHLYYRALSKCPFYYKLWHQFLIYKLNLLEEEPLYQDIYSVSIDFEMCLLFLQQMPKIYHLYLDFLIDYMPYKTTTILKVLNMALLHLPYPLHKSIWQRILEFAKSLNNHLGALLLSRYYLTLTESIDKQELISLLFEMHVPTAISLFLKFIKSNRNANSYIEHIICEYTIELHEHINIPTFLNELLSKRINFKLINGLARYYIQTDDLQQAISTFEMGLSQAINIYDAIMIYEQYLFVMEQYISMLLESNKSPNITNLWVDRYAYLLQRHMLLIQSTLTRQFPNSIDIWRNYIKLQKLLNKPLKPAYQLAISTIDVKRATPLNTIHLFWQEYALECGDDVYNEATNYKFTNPNDLQEMYIIKAAHFHSDTVKARSIYKQGIDVCSGASIWSAYLDFEESLDSDQVVTVYEACITKKQATPQIFMNYIVYLLDNQMFNAAFAIFERALESFKTCHTELYSSYLPYLVSLYKDTKVERIRNCFDQCLERVPKVDLLKFINWYAVYELEYGMIKKAIKVYENGAKALNSKDKVRLYEMFIKQTVKYFSLDAARNAYNMAIQDLLDDDAREFCLEYIKFELENGEFDRARELYSWTSQLCNPMVNSILI